MITPQSGVYFVTICTHQKECLLGFLADGEMVLNDIEKNVEWEWLKSAEIRDEIGIG
jgi:putative transposase